MSLADALARFQARAQSNLPQLAVGGTSVAFNLARAFLSDAEDTRYLITQSAPNMAVSTATGAALDAKAADYGITRGPGTYSTGTVIFSVPSGVAPVTYTFPAGTVLSTPGDGVTSQPVYFTTTAATSISSGSSSSPSVAVQAQKAGSGGTVGAGAISVIVTAGLSGFTVTNAAGTSAAIDPDTDTQLRARIFSTIAPRYAAAALAATALAVSGVYDVYVLDPQDGTGGLTISWADVLGAQPGATGTALQAAVNAVLPAGIKASAITYAAFTIDNVTAMALSYSAPTSVLSSTIEPQIQTAVKAYIQGLVHNQVPTIFGLISYVVQATGYVLFNLVYTSSTPTIVGATPSNTTLWRLTGNAPSVVSLTRV